MLVKVLKWNANLRAERGELKSRLIQEIDVGKQCSLTR